MSRQRLPARRLPGLAGADAVDLDQRAGAVAVGLAALVAWRGCVSGCLIRRVDTATRPGGALLAASCRLVERFIVCASLLIYWTGLESNKHRACM